METAVCASQCEGDLLSLQALEEQAFSLGELTMQTQAASNDLYRDINQCLLRVRNMNQKVRCTEQPANLSYVQHDYNHQN